MLDRYPDIMLYDLEIEDYYHRSWDAAYSDNSMRPSVWSAMWRIYSNGHLKATSQLDLWYESSPATFEPVAWIEWCLYHKAPRKKRVKSILPKIEDYLASLSPRDSRDRLVWAINYLFASALADAVADEERKMLYAKGYYKIKNSFGRPRPEDTHLAMLAEIAHEGDSVDLDRLQGPDFYMALKGLEKYHRHAEARNAALARIYDTMDAKPDPLLGIAALVENIVGVQYSAERKTLEFRLPEFENMGMLGMKIGKNTFSLRSAKTKRGRCVSVNSDAMVYFTVTAEGFRDKSLPVAHSMFSWYLERLG